MGNNLLINCCLIFVLRSLKIDVGSVFVWISSTMQVLIACTLGQKLQDEVTCIIFAVIDRNNYMEILLQAKIYSDTLYEIDWLNMTVENRKHLLLMIKGSHRKVNIQAGQTYELNLSLFLQVN